LSKIHPVGWRTLKKIFEKYGCHYVREKGDHIILQCPGARRPVIIPKYSEIPVSIIKINMKTVNMTREEYLKLLKEVG